MKVNQKEEKIVEYLKNQYNPDAIILHGSRAINQGRPHSDWDFIFLFNTEPLAGDFREVVDGENVEVQSELLPIEEDKILDQIGLKLQNAKVLFEKENEGTELFTKARRVYEVGFQWPETWPNGPNLWMQGRIGGMKDNSDDSLLFYRYFCQFYPRAINDWFRVLHRQFPKPEYLALPHIQEEDLEYYVLLTELVDPSVTLEEKVSTAEKIRVKLFGESF